ncbi:MAG TPA: hypothetical protein VGN20_03905 [Mucilaginibacter sp.]|jgi:hypothetical protein
MPRFYFVLFFACSFLISSTAKGQFPVSFGKDNKPVLKKPEVKVAILLLKNSYIKTDSIKVQVTITNKSTKDQKVIFGKHSGSMPWGMSANVVNKYGKSVTESTTRALTDSHFYFESELEKKGYYYYLKPGEKDTWTYYLDKILVFNYDNFNQLKPGTYNLELSYFGNPSNKITFIIQKP